MVIYHGTKVKKKHLKQIQANLAKDLKYIFKDLLVEGFLSACVTNEGFTIFSGQVVTAFLAFQRIPFPSLAATPPLPLASWASTTPPPPFLCCF